jgi:hypothetical protein
MSLIFANGESFATGALRYSYGPATPGETTNRIIMPVEIEGVSTNAVVDTGAPYVICEPRIARQMGFDPTWAIGREKMLVRGMWLDGSIARLSVKLEATIGTSIDVDATAFVPDVEEFWGDLPSFIGLMGFLERIRFAVDPSTDTFYFGKL